MSATPIEGQSSPTAQDLPIEVARAHSGTDALRLLAAIPAAIYTCDTQGRVTFFNDAAAQLWGRRPQLGVDLWCGSWKIFLPDGTPVDLGECPMAIALLEGHPVVGEEIIIERPDGTRRRVRPHPEPIRDASGALVGAVNLLVDITEQREDEIARARLAAIVESSDDAIVSKTLDGIVTSWNSGAQRIFGWTPDEIIGRPITLLIPEDRHAEERDILQHIRRGERVDHFETVRVAKDGRRLDVSVTVSPVRDRAGHIIGASKVARDITQRNTARQIQQALLEKAVAERTRELEESHRRLRLSERMASLGTLSTGLGHDLGNLLLPIRVSLETLGGADLPEPSREGLESIRTCVEYLQQLATGLRMLTLDPQRAGLPAVTHLPHWWSQAHAIIRNALPNGITLVTEIADCAVAMPSSALTQAVFNLVQNAGNALRPRGHGLVRITARPNADRVLLTIEDNGPGMPPHIRDHCMEPFFTTMSRGISTGLGLVIVAGLVRDAGGAVTLRTAPGEGAAFTLDLPAAPSSNPGAPRTRARALVDIRDARLRALVSAELEFLSLEIVALPAPDGSRIDIAVIDRPPEGPLARQIVLLDDAAEHPSHVVPIGPAPSPGTIRRALRTAAQLCAGGEPTQ